HFNNHAGVPQNVINEYLSLISADPKVRIIYHPTGVGNGRPITEMTLVSQEDLVCLLEDDCFPFTPGVLDKEFKEIESGKYDAVGSPRFSCGLEIADAAKSKYGLNYEGYGDRGPNFWPAFFYFKRSDLLKTDLNFASYAYEQGKYYKEIDHTMQETQYGDTFVHTSLQLRSFGLRFKEIPAHKADPYEIESKEKKEMNWHSSQQPFDYIHGGSLSAGWGGYLSGIVPDVSPKGAMEEMESRCAFWFIVAESVGSSYPDFREHYINGILSLINNAHLDQERIDRKKALYRALMNV
ncbi:MAG TPA: hypothetical protein ACFYD4_06155, partial [Candidatus Wunengus sp. YC61]|uniref:hypothetical protein n=1 Tax=Candidatus Wunengus sp. YC61 TaxID=3367698 RepID=UPI004029B41F